MSFDFQAMTRTLVGDGLFGDWITYTKADGTTRRIRARVLRQPPDPIEEAPNQMRYNEIVIVENDATSGISVAELETSSDTLTYPSRLGGADVVHAIGRIAGQQNGRLQLEAL